MHCCSLCNYAILSILLNPCQSVTIVKTTPPNNATTVSILVSLIKYKKTILISMGTIYVVNHRKSISEYYNTKELLTLTIFTDMKYAFQLWMISFIDWKSFSPPRMYGGMNSRERKKEVKELVLLLSQNISKNQKYQMIT